MKKTFYILISIVFGILLSFIAHALIEILYLNWADKYDLIVQWHSLAGKPCALPPFLALGLLIAGIIFGVWFGFKAWQEVYIRRKRGLFLKIK